MGFDKIQNIEKLDISVSPLQKFFKVQTVKKTR